MRGVVGCVSIQLRNKVGGKKKENVVYRTTTNLCILRLCAMTNDAAYPVRNVMFLSGTTTFLPPGSVPIAVLAPCDLRLYPDSALRAFDINTVGLFYEITFRFPWKLLITS